MSSTDWIVKVWLCGIAAMIVMGAGGILRNAWKASRANDESEE